MPTYKGVEIDTQPTQEMAEEAQRGLDWREEFGRGGTEVGVARARDITNRENLSFDTINRMVSYFARHEVDKEGEGFSPGEDGYPSAGRIAWALWGGDAGQSWANAINERMDKLDENDQGERPYPNEHAARLQDPSKYSEFRRETEAGGPGIDFIYGLFEMDGEITSELQAIRFDADRYSETEAVAWLDEHDFQAIEFEPAIQEKTAETLASEVSDDLKSDRMEYDRKNLSFRADGMDMEPQNDRRIRMSVSSELPVERYNGMEILDHSTESIDMEFLNSGRAPLLLDHDPSQQIGVIESVELDAATRRLRATVRFGKGERASEVYDDVMDGIRSNVSIGYYVKKSVNEEGGVYRATSWTPVEVSVVSLPADPSVGVGRSKPIPVERKITVEANEIVAQRNKEVSEIISLATRHNKRDLADKAIASGMSIDQFRGALLDQIGDKPLESPEIDLTQKEKREYSLMRAINNAANGKVGGFEREISDELAKKYGREARGFYVPSQIMFKRDIATTSTYGSGSNLISTDHLAAEYIDALRANLVIAGLGARMLQGLRGNVSIPALNAKTSVGFVAENAAPGSEGAPTFRAVTMSPKTLLQYVDISRRLAMQSDPSVEQLVRDDMTRQFAAKIDEVAIEGSSGGAEPTGILATSGIGAVTIGTNGGALTYAKVVELEKEVAVDNALAGNLAYLTNPKVVASMRTTPRQATGVEGNFILNDSNMVLGYDVASTTLVPSDLTKGSGSALSALIFGNFNDLMIGMFGGLDVLVDPYTGSSTGAIRVALYQDVDVAVRHAESFAAIKEIVA